MRELIVVDLCYIIRIRKFISKERFEKEISYVAILIRTCLPWQISLEYIKRKANKRNFNIIYLKQEETERGRKDGINAFKMGNMCDSLFEPDNSDESLRKETGDYPCGSPREALRTPKICIARMHPR